MPLTLLTPRWSHCVLIKVSSLNIYILGRGLPVAQELAEPLLDIPTVSGAASMKNKEKEDKCGSPYQTMVGTAPASILQSSTGSPRIQLP